MAKGIKSDGPGDQTGGSVVVSDKANKDAIKDQRDQMRDKAAKEGREFKEFERE